MDQITTATVFPRTPINLSLRIGHAGRDSESKCCQKVETSLFLSNRARPAACTRPREAGLASLGLAAAPPGDSFNDLSLHLPALCLHHDLPRFPYQPRLELVFFALSLPPNPPLPLFPPRSPYGPCLACPLHCPLRMSFALSQPFRFSLDTLATTVIFPSCNRRDPDHR